MNHACRPSRWIAPVLMPALMPVMLVAPAVARAASVPVAELGLDHVHQEWGKPQADQSVDGHPLAVAGVHFDAGLGTHAASALWVDLGGAGERFTAKVGVDDEVADHAAEAKRLGVTFTVIGDNKTLFKSGRMRVGDAAKSIDVDLHGVKTLILRVEAAGGEITYGHADWADAAIAYTGAKPTAFDPPAEPAEVLTPEPPATPRINSAKAFGVRPTHPVMYTVAATGTRPMAFAADGLPPGVALDGRTGRLTGAVEKAGTYVVHLHATNGLGTADRDLKLVVGDPIALTPPMGWNSWNCFASNVSQEKVQAAADAMVSSGLIDHGWTYVNVDDCWEIPAGRPAEQRRAADGHILTNAKFPDMKAMADYVHARGLRAGLYSSPGPSTCGNFTASYQHESDDAKQYAAWGFDYVKYDWCSYDGVARKLKKDFNSRRDVEMDQAPYKVMSEQLARQDRDILFSLCQYGMGDVWKWGPAVGGNCWRTTGDINDSWGSMSGIGFGQAGHEAYAGPGHWNDPDMLVVGKVGWGPSLHPTKLTPNEQYTHISLWCLLSAPLLIGCDMTQLDPFTKGLLTNDEVLAVNQDPLGKQAARAVKTDDGVEVWMKELDDGSHAVGVFNRGEMPATPTVKWADLGLAGPQAVRDLWRQKDLGTPGETFAPTVGRHGCVMVRVAAAK